ncbi:MAG: hypothetical protein LAO08_20175 [Acidobacteriia bacterium]|nr:hypothetical protein [Terriglobia bacterium]
MIDYYGVPCDQCAGRATGFEEKVCHKCHGSGTVAVLAVRPGISRPMLRVLAVTMLAIAAAVVTVLVHFR